MKHRLYYSMGCGYCVRVLALIEKLNFEIELCDIWQDQQYYHYLQKITGKTQVPCLFRIDEQDQEEWLFESRDIMAYLQELNGQ